MARALSCPKCGTPFAANAQFCPTCGISYANIAVDLTSYQQADLSHLPTTRLSSEPLINQRYRLLKIIGQGGMGTVYGAQDTQLAHRLVALKEMRLSHLSPEDFPLAREQFRHEAHLLASLSHPSLPAIYDYFTENGHWYLVMPLIEGQDLQSLLNTTAGNKMPINEVIRIGIALCEVLEYLHMHEPPIIFRDLKPSNIMLTPSGHICLIDFGVARYFKPEQTHDTIHFSSIGYTSPEQYALLQTSPRSDLYSLGVTLHQMLSGHNPSDQPFHFAPLSAVDPDIPFPLAKLVMQMVQKDAQNRPESAALVKQQLGRLLIPDSDRTLNGAQPERVVHQERPFPSPYIAPNPALSPLPNQITPSFQATRLKSRSLARRSVLGGLLGGIVVVAGGVFVWRKATTTIPLVPGPVRAQKTALASPTVSGRILWTTPQRIAGTASQAAPALATFSNKVLNLAYVNDTRSNELLSLSSQNSGATWGPILDVGQSSHSAPALAVSADGTLDLIFTANNSGDGLLAMSSQNNGATWSNVPYTGQNSSAAPALAISPSGVLHLVCLTDDGNHGLLHLSSPDNGQTWSNAQPISGQFSKTTPALAIGKDGLLHLLFTANNDGNGLMYMFSQDNGQTWSNTSFTGQASLLAPALAILNTTLYLAFVASDGSNQLCIVSSQDGFHWSDAQETRQSSLLAPALSVLNNALYLAFVASDGSNQICLFSSPGRG